jgi:DNA repair protein RAD50
LEKDLKDYKEIHKKYAEQLIKVKVGDGFILSCSQLKRAQMSDMANNDLEKYAKALDKCVSACSVL